MAHIFTPEETAEWLARQPKKVISAKAVLYNDRDEILMVQPNYKHGLQFVGGLVDGLESPLQAVLREIKEEVGLTLMVTDLTFLGTRFGISPEKTDDYIHFLFAARLSAAQIDAITLEEAELDGMRWIPVNTFSPEVSELTYHFFMKLRGQGAAAGYADHNDNTAFLPVLPVI